MAKTQPKTQPATKAAQAGKGKAAQGKAAPATSTAATLAAANSAAPVASAAQPVKRPPIVYANGLTAGAPANAPAVTIAGQPFSGSLPATNPANRGAVGAVKNAGAMLTAGNGKQPKSAHGAAMWAAVTAALAAGKGKATAATLANAAGHGGAAFVGYCLKNGWLAVAA